MIRIIKAPIRAYGYCAIIAGRTTDSSNASGFALHEPTHPRPLRGGEQAFVHVVPVPLLGGVRGGFMVPMHGKNGVGALHEPRSAAVPAASCCGVSPPARTSGETPGKLAGEDACATAAGQFMVPMHSKKRKGAFHEPPFPPRRRSRPRPRSDDL